MPASFVPGDSGFDTNTPADIAWSEYNHNCAGLLVFLMGILALLSRSRYFSWAKDLAVDVSCCLPCFCFSGRS